MKSQQEKMKRYVIAMAAVGLLLLNGGCDDSSDPENEAEVITTVTLTFTPSGGGTPVSFAFDDPDGDGGNAPTIDGIDLQAGDYDLAITFENGLEDPPEDITVEVAEEDEEHQVFFTGTAVDGPASDQPGAPFTHTYSDADPLGNPVGLANTVTAIAGTGTLTLTLRHMPPVGGVAVKDGGAAAAVQSGGFAAIGGENDVQVDFAVTVQ